jgi:hypothetical protein
MDILQMLNCTEILDKRVFHGSLRGKHFLVIIMNGRRADGYDDRPAFATSDECPELADVDGPVIVWWKGVCRGTYKKSAPSYFDGRVYRHPLKKVADL